ncbi:protein phosphatase 1 regulatory subunit 3C-like [Ptychodera flava]|uniref:protein phosphatase 1 regulatory subunit 3C-like n=1 Tax=Ptychodera flava TaxID=63121 RepID=UPI003969DAC9
MFYTKERPVLCRFGPCQFNGSAVVCRTTFDMPKQSSGHDPPRCDGGGGVDVNDRNENQARDTKPRQRQPSGSCLKSPTGSPPSSPARKSVRFADSIGMELEAVRIFEKCDSDYELNLPDSFMKSVLRSRRFMAHCQNNYRVPSEKYLEPCFLLPDSDISNNVREKKVCLESYEVKDLSVKANVRVANIAFEKSVKVRFTITDWATHYDLPARYVDNSNDGHTDKFTFEIALPRDFVIGCRLEFAVKYEVDGQTYWDNNSDDNYAYECTDNRRTSRP